ncbi:hypothetical protein K4F52_004835 [Lecanicillium sp. MT-2017a]|nr:hypothetical protein K4F52_004835 [Lecanicillium sp. MT-2017a]
MASQASAATSVSLPNETYPDARASYVDDSFLTGGSTDKSAPEYGEVGSRLRADTQMHVENESFDARNSQLPASDVSWARQGVNMPMLSMEDYVPHRMGASGHRKGHQHQLPQHQQCSNPVAPRNAQSFGGYSTMGSSLHHIVPSNAYGVPGGHTATPRQTPENSGPWLHTLTNSKGSVAVTCKDIKTETPASSSPRLPKKNHVHQSATMPERVKTGDSTAHNDIEKKYRTNLKRCFAELQAAIPALNKQGDCQSDDTTNQATLKVSKATILSKATEYIKQLEQATLTMANERQQLTEMLHVLEQQREGQLLHSPVEEVSSEGIAVFQL